MQKKLILTILAALLVAVAPVLAGGANILANGTIDIAATATPSTNTQNVGVYNNTGNEWGLVYGFRVANGTDFPVTNVLSCVDLGGSATVATVVCASQAVSYVSLVDPIGFTNAVVYRSGTNDLNIYTNLVKGWYAGAPFPAHDLLITSTTPTNDAAGEVSYYIYGQ